MGGAPFVTQVSDEAATRRAEIVYPNLLNRCYLEGV